MLDIGKFCASADGGAYALTALSLKTQYSGAAAMDQGVSQVVEPAMTAKPSGFTP